MPNGVAYFSVEANRLQTCVEQSLRKDGEMPIVTEMKNQTVITTRFREVNIEGLKRIARLPSPAANWSNGRYRMRFVITPENPGHSAVAIEAQIFANPSAASRRRFPLMNPMRPIEWSIVLSNGHLERRWRDILLPGLSACARHAD